MDMHSDTGAIYTFTSGLSGESIPFIVLLVDKRGLKWGLPLVFEHNEHGVPVIFGAFSYQQFGDTAAGLQQLPKSAKPADTLRAALAEREAEVERLIGWIHHEFGDDAANDARATITPGAPDAD